MFKVIIQTLKVCVLFTGCTLFFYYGILVLSKEYESYQRYNEPEGRAIKVFQTEEPIVHSSWIERLLLFYQEGE